MENLPLYISVFFILTTVFSLLFFYYASRWSRAFLAIAFIWLIIQSVLSLALYYTKTDTMPPRLLLAVIPPILLILGLFATVRGRRWLDQLDLGRLTLLHAVRVPVELVLFWLFLQKTIPQEMTFEGRNFDILAGIGAILIYYFGFIKKQLTVNALLLFNFLGLVLLLNIMFHGILSLPTPFQQFGFEQPNIALMYFPFVWLPSCIVPLVLVSHLASIRLLLQRRKAANSRTAILKTNIALD
jgi:hypothetical protein